MSSGTSICESVQSLTHPTIQNFAIENGTIEIELLKTRHESCKNSHNHSKIAKESLHSSPQREGIVARGSPRYLGGSERRRRHLLI